MFPGAPLRCPQVEFTPPKSKSNAERQSCPCNWGDEYCRLKTFFDGHNHALGGFVETKFSDSCNIQKYLHGVYSFLRVPGSVQRKNSVDFEQWNSDRNNFTQPHIRVTKHHFPLDFVLSNQVRFTFPITRDRAEEVGGYRNRNPAPHQDSLIKYNPSIGVGQTPNSKKKNKTNQTLLRIVPCATRDEVIAIAKSIDPSCVNKERSQARAATIESRTPKYWENLVQSMQRADDDRDTHITQLKNKINELEESVEFRKSKANAASAKTRMENARQRNDAAERHTARDREAIWDSVKELVSKVGGLSRMTIFNSKWPENNPEAAKELFGFNSYK